MADKLVVIKKHQQNIMQTTLNKIKAYRNALIKIPWGEYKSDFASK